MPLTDGEIASVQNRLKWKYDDNHTEHFDCVRIAYEWLDAQENTKGYIRDFIPLKHYIESWGRRYVSTFDVQVAAELHPRIVGEYPRYNISRKFTQPLRGRLDKIGEANKHDTYDHIYQDIYKKWEGNC